MKPEPKEESVSYHRPEFVVIEEDTASASFSGYKEEEQYKSLFGNLKKVESTWAIRIMAFFACFLLIAVAAFSLFFTTISFLLAAFTLFKNSQANQAALKSWKNFKKILVCALGLAIGVFSPSLGFGLVFLYFVLHDEVLDPRFGRFMKFH